jgi:hypothetical protein
MLTYKTLVIHPSDPSTDFLKPIYANLAGEVLVLNRGKTKDEVRELINQHDRIIMLGHGIPQGLLSIGQFDTKNGLIIDETMIAALGTKRNNVYIWCNADRFVKHYYLKGFYSGMFISEYSEAVYCRVPTFAGEVEQSNDMFAKIVGENIEMEAKNLCDITKINYYITESKVTKYNNDRLYWK